MKIYYSQTLNTVPPIEADLTSFDLKKSIEKTRQALEIAYSGFNNAVDADLIDSYIYEINALQKRYAHLTGLTEKLPAESDPLHPHASVRTLIRHIFCQGVSSVS